MFMSDVSKQDKRTRKALKSYRCRTLKNILIWFIGMLTCIVLLVGSVFVGIKVIPISTYTGGNNEEYVSDDIASSSILDAVLNIDKYKMADLPVLTNLVDSLLNGAGLNEYVTVDQEKLKDIKFVYSDGSTNFAQEFQACIKITASIQSVGGADALGSLGNLSAFKEWEVVESEEDKPVLDENGNVKKDGENFLSNPKLYYYDSSVKTSENAPLSAGTARYDRAFDDDGVRIAPVDAQLYFPNLSEIPFLDACNVMGDSISRLPASEVLNSFGEGVKDGFIGKVLGDKKISELKDTDENDFYLKDVLDTPDERLKEILTDIYGDYDTITVGNLHDFKMDDLHLAKVLKDPNGNLKNVLVDAFSDSVTSYEEITVSMLAKSPGEGGFDFNNVHLGTVINKTNNPILSALIDEKNCSVGEIGTEIDALSLYSAYGKECFTTTAPTDGEILRYKRSEDGGVITYTYDAANGDYYLSKNAGIWLLLCFDGDEFYKDGDNKGRPQTYTVSNRTFSSLEGDGVSKVIANAYVRQLIDAGIIPAANTEIYGLSLSQALNR
jgi:hypothetical protein